MTAGFVSLVGLGVYQHFNQSGEYEHLEPTKNQYVQIDNNMRIGSWNMRGQARTRWRQISGLINDYDLDAMALQEVTADDINTLHKHLRAFHIVFVEADSKQHILDGGYGDALITSQDPQNIQTRSFPGTPLLKSVIGAAEGLGQDIASGDTSFYYTKQGMQENRAAVAETIKVATDGKLVDARIMTSHIAGVRPEHKTQLHQLLDFIQDNESADRLTVFCGDMNTSSTQAIPAFANIRMVSPQTGPTSVDGGGTIDHCAYYYGGQPGVAHVQVLNKPTTDHRPLIFTLALKP